MNKQGKDSPVQSESDNQEWGWQVRHFSQRQHGSYQNNFDR